MTAQFQICHFFSYFIFGFFVFFWQPICTDPVERLKIVPLSSNAEEFYVTVRERNKNVYSQEPTNIDSRIKSRICESILSSAAFKRVGLKSVNVDQWYSPTLSELRTYGSHHLKGDARDKEEMEFQTPFQFPNKKRIVRLKRTDKCVSDNAFMCVGIYSKQYVRLYVSEEYNVNLITPNQLNVPGRFVFVRQVSPFSLLNVAFLATEAASVIEGSPKKVEELYLESRKNEQTAERQEDDPVCKMNGTHPIQICSSVLNSAYFDNKISYTMTTRSIRCIKNEVSFRKFPDEKLRSEWMVKCVAVARMSVGGIRKRTQESIYVSRGTSEENFFVYFRNLGSESYYLLNLSTNIIKYLM